MSQRVLVIGPGWLGSALVDSLTRSGHPTWSMRRGAPADVAVQYGADAPHVALHGDITAWGGVHAPDALPVGCPGAVDAVVLCVSPSRARGDTHESTYPAASRGAVRLAAALGARTLLQVSSTGVYARTDGSVVTETTAVMRDDARQRALADAEELVWNEPSNTPLGRVVLRVAGLYGSARDPAARFASDALDSDGGYWCNFAWRDDVVSAIEHLLTMPSHASGAHCYNCADGTPMLARDIHLALSRAAGESNGATAATHTTGGAGAGAATPRGRSNQRVDVSRLLATGWRPSMPTVLHGLEALGHDVSSSRGPVT